MASPPSWATSYAHGVAPLLKYCKTLRTASASYCLLTGFHRHAHTHTQTPTKQTTNPFCINSEKPSPRAILLPSLCQILPSHLQNLPHPFASTIQSHHTTTLQPRQQVTKHSLTQPPQQQTTSTFTHRGDPTELADRGFPDASSHEVQVCRTFPSTSAWPEKPGLPARCGSRVARTLLTSLSSVHCEPA